jgi:hypothetical protein
MAVVAAMMSTITMATTPPTMATVLSEAEPDGSIGAAAVCGGGIAFPGPTGAIKNLMYDTS